MTTIIYIGIAFAAIILLGGIIYLILRPNRRSDASLEYTTALNYLISGDKKSALKKLREAVQYNTSNIDAYIKIGDIYREQGFHDRAIKIHRGLTVRRNLTLGQKIDLYKSLIKDYESARKFERAVSVADNLIDLTANEIWAQKIKLKVYENAGKWDDAIEVLKTLQKTAGEKDSCLLALYKVESGARLIRKGKEKEGRVKFREAIKLDKKCPPAHLNLSDSYLKEERYKDALTELKKFMTQDPDKAYLAFNRIKNILFRIGSFGEIETIFIKLLEKNPDNVSIRLALADVYERKGKLNKAIDLCYEALEKNANSNEAKLQLTRFLPRINKKDEALKYALDIIENTCRQKDKNTICKECGYLADEPLWRCPNCFNWNSFLE
ncbi:tetratricopeptide repeat protein [candidate division KSB1 bacterium]|nr:tetratricopeptide repeat protein [candidate division KSB1 bacterium]